MNLKKPLACLALVLALGACNSHRASDRALAGGVIGAGTGALIGGLATGRGSGAVAGALIGGAGGAIIGAGTTPRRYYGQRYRGRACIAYDRYGNRYRTRC